MSDNIKIDLKIIAEGKMPRVELLEGALGDGLKGFDSVLKKLRQKYPDRKILNDLTFNFVGYRLLRNGKNQYAIDIFKRWVESSPDSYNAHDSLGEAYLSIGDKKNAIKHYEISLKLNPENENAEEMLKVINDGKL